MGYLVYCWNRRSWSRNELGDKKKRSENENGEEEEWKTKPSLFSSSFIFTTTRQNPNNNNLKKTSKQQHKKTTIYSDLLVSRIVGIRKNGVTIVYDGWSEWIYKFVLIDMEIYGYEFVIKTCDRSGNHSWFWVLCFLFVINLFFFFWILNFWWRGYEDEVEDEGRRWWNEKKN